MKLSPPGTPAAQVMSAVMRTRRNRWSSARAISRSRVRERAEGRPSPSWAQACRQGITERCPASAKGVASMLCRGSRPGRSRGVVSATQITFSPAARPS
nr:hypothetical protein [Actinocorallia populi]